jgi:hypothetical protein
LEESRRKFGNNYWSKEGDDPCGINLVDLDSRDVSEMEVVARSEDNVVDLGRLRGVDQDRIEFPL